MSTSALVAASQLVTLDWVIIIVYFAITLTVGLGVSRRAGRSVSQFFLSGRTMPWWLLGFSMVATTFSTDTPNLVTDIVRQNGVAGNWVWWAFLLTGMLTVFIYAKLWRRSGVLTDMEFYELRYSGKMAAFLRGFRAIYLGLFFNMVIMATVTLAAIKIGGILLGLQPWQTVLVAGTVTVIFAAVGGFRAVLVTDAILFVTAITGSMLAAWYALGHPEVGGLSGLISHPDVADKLRIIPSFDNWEFFLMVFLIPLAVQWWAAYYPGAEPGGGGYVAQRMLAAKTERHAVGATLFFNIAHYAIRPWPWIIVALCSVIVYPTVADIHEAFPAVSREDLGEDLAYSAMLTFLPAGLLGFVVASLAAAYMSTISTQLNWGSSYFVNDVFRRFIAPEAPEKACVAVGRIFTAALMVLSAFLALWFENALAAFGMILKIGAGTGLIFILRWFWWRINAESEIIAMVVSFVIAIGLEVAARQGWHSLGDHWQLLIIVGVTTPCWLAAAYFGKQTTQKKLREFYRKTSPGGPGWRAVIEQARKDGEELHPEGRPWDVPIGVLCMVLGCFTVYGALFGTGYWLYGNVVPASILTVVTVVSAILLFIAARKINFETESGEPEG